MGSRGRMPPPAPHLERPLPDPGIAHPDAFAPGIRLPPGAFPPFDMPPHPEILEKKLSAQHLEMQKLFTENRRLAGTHGTLRQELAAAQHELHMLHAQIEAVKSERELQMRSLMDKIARMQADLQATDVVKSELDKVRADAQSLFVARQELISKVQKLTQDLQRAHADAQIIPALVSELEGLRQEFQRCRVTYDHEKKLYNDHLESLQVMEKNYVDMAREVEKLQAELKNAAEKRTDAAGPYGRTGYNGIDVSGQYPAAQKTSEDVFGVPQGPVALPGTGAAFASFGGIPGAQSGPAHPRSSYDVTPPSGYEAQKVPTYDVQRGPGYDPQRGLYYDPQRGYGYGAPGGAGYEQQRGAGFDPQRAAGYDAQRGHAYEAQRGAGYEAQRGSGYDMAKGAGYDLPKTAGYPLGQATSSSNMAYVSMAPPISAGMAETAARGGKPGPR